MQTSQPFLRPKCSFLHSYHSLFLAPYTLYPSFYLASLFSSFSLCVSPSTCTFLHATLSSYTYLPRSYSSPLRVSPFLPLYKNFSSLSLHAIFPLPTTSFLLLSELLFQNCTTHVSSFLLSLFHSPISSPFHPFSCLFHVPTSCATPVSSFLLSLFPSTSCTSPVFLFILSLFFSCFLFRFHHPHLYLVYSFSLLNL